MEIRKADSKGRVTGFEPGMNYSIRKGENGDVFLGVVGKIVILAPDGRPVEDALREFIIENGEIVYEA